MDFNQHFGKFRALWAELEMLRPSTVEPSVLNDRREQEKVFALIITLNPGYNDLIKHMLRAEKLPCLEEVCAQVQKEQVSVGLFGGKGDLVLANQAEGVANKGFYKPEDKKVWTCEHCKKKGHGKDKCWTLHPHLKPQKFRSPYNDARAHFSGGMGEPATPSTRSTMNFNSSSEGKALASSSCSTVRTIQDEALKRSDLDALIKALKENSGNNFGISLNASTNGGDAVLTACYLINRIPTRILQDQSPYEVLNKTRPTIDHMRVFGCLCFVLIPGEQRNKLEAKSTRAMFIGYSPHQKGYKCYVPETRRVLISRDVKFVESKGFYGEQSWDELKNLSQSASDRANNLRRVMESLGISMPEERIETEPEGTTHDPTAKPEPMSTESEHKNVDIVNLKKEMEPKEELG
ncbi:hypothetical protein N665_1804s0001 [Sinapis alba]|nr:hypothetical protein N665_1804s0001 [Sinapis alba]